MRYPAVNTADLSIRKRFWISDFTLDAWCQISNLFDNHGMHGIADIQDIEWYHAELHGGGGRDYSENRDPTGRLGNPYAFIQSRMIRFGLGFNW
jgi:hypothetical protein